MTAIAAQDVTKTFQIYPRPLDRVKTWSCLGLVRFSYPFTALRDIAFTINAGEQVGLIGYNGSGKTTLLKVLAGVYRSTTGHVELRGRVTTILALGIGFRHDLTGRENVHFYFARRGYSRAPVREKTAWVQDFIDIGEFFDYPVRLYSSGMVARLAFATTFNSDANIYLIDETLAVADYRFQQKCIEHLRGLRRRGATVLIAGHGLALLSQLCDRVLLLHEGKLIMDGPADDTISTYVSLLHRPDMSAESVLQQQGQLCEIVNETFDVNEAAGAAGPGLLCYELTLRLQPQLKQIIVRAQLDGLSGLAVGLDEKIFDAVPGKVLHCGYRVPQLFLTPGDYRITLQVLHRPHGLVAERHRIFTLSKGSPAAGAPSIGQIEHTWL